MRKVAWTLGIAAAFLLALAVGKDMALKAVVTAAARRTEVTVSARKFMLPKPEIASGVLRELAQRLE